MVLVDGSTLTQWQGAAIQAAQQRGLEIVGVLSCSNTTSRRRLLHHAGYYVLRVTSLRCPENREVELSTVLGSQVPVHVFESEYHKAWQVLPHITLTHIEHVQPDVVIKFGMGLLRDADQLPARLGVLSYHHGDPAQYRGRPAAFYETLHRADHMGVMVQRLSNRLDAGTVLAYAEVPVAPHSLRGNLGRAYRISPHLLWRAIEAAHHGREVERSVQGVNYRLPSNRQVLGLIAAMARRRIARYAYGVTVDKQWRILDTTQVDPTAVSGNVTLAAEAWPLPQSLRFVADPFPLADGTVLCEAMPHWSGRGRLATLDQTGVARMLDTTKLSSGHLSYPHIVEQGEHHWLVAEMSDVGGLTLGLLDDGCRIVEVRSCEGLQHQRLLDPTLHRDGRRWWLFAGLAGTDQYELNVWSADDLFGPYRAHPQNPVVITPQGARPAGPLFSVDGRLYRPGQDCRVRYGDGVVLHEVTELNDDHYSERRLGRLGLEGLYGPHTLAYSEQRQVWVVDGFKESRTWAAGMYRLLGRLGR